MISFSSAGSTSAIANNPLTGSLNRFLDDRFTTQGLELVSTLIPGAGNVLSMVMQLLSLFGLKAPSEETGVRSLPNRADSEQRGMQHSTITRWAAYFVAALKDTHSHRSQHSNSEYNVLAQAAAVADIPLVNHLQEYQKMIDEDGRLGATAAEALQTDQPAAQVVQRSHEVYQVVSAQTRFQASTGVYVNAATINPVSHQYLNQTRFYHVVADTAHYATQVTWQRAEKVHVTMADIVTRHGNGLDFHKRYERYSNNTALYSKQLYRQVGSLEHKASARTWVAENYTLEAYLGNTRTVARNDAILASNQGSTTLNGLLTVLYGEQTLTARTPGIMAFDAGVVLINCGLSIIPDPRQRELSEDGVKPLPDYTSPCEYIKELPPLPTNRVRQGGDAPLPQTAQVSTNSGQFVQGSSGFNILPALGSSHD